MPRLQDPDSKVIVNVDDAYGETLKGLGWKLPADETKAPARKAASKSSD